MISYLLYLFSLFRKEAISVMGCGMSKSIQNDGQKGDGTFRSESSHNQSPHHENRDDRRNVDGRQSRVRRLSQTVFEAEELRVDDPVTISVPVPIPVGEHAAVPARKRRDRRASYIQLDSDPRSIVQDVAFSCVAGAESGRPKRNQDSVLIFMDTSACIFAVFDGHGQHGHHCSNFVKTCLPSLIKLHILKDISVKEAIERSIKESEEALLSAPFDCGLSGTTATIAVVQPSRILIGWVGDSPCFIVKEFSDSVESSEIRIQNGAGVSFDCESLMIPHNFDIPTERQRALTMGGRVMRWSDDTDWVGPLRIFQQQSPTPGLNMSRSLGDTIGHKIGVSGEPDVKIIDLDSKHKFLVICSDGVTEFMSSKDIAEVILKFPNDLQKACDDIVMKSRALWTESEGGSIDDISVVVVKLFVNSADMTNMVPA